VYIKRRKIQCPFKGSHWYRATSEQYKRMYPPEVPISSRK
jgi:hypothetical protein